MVQEDTELDDNGTGVNPCIGHISGNETLGVPSICMGDGPAGTSQYLLSMQGGQLIEQCDYLPAPVAAAASWNTTLQYAYGQALAQEHMAKGRNVVLSPTINILRSLLWARAAETFSEDPWLTTRMVVAGVSGVQSEGALASVKHYAAYNQDANRFGLDPEWKTVDIHVDTRALHELYLPGFKAAVQEADVASVMCSYNMLNGQFTCENDWLLNKTLRQDWGLEGFVVADWYFSTRSTISAVMSGLDISMPGGSLEDSYGFPAYYGDLLVEAITNASRTLIGLAEEGQAPAWFLRTNRFGTPYLAVSASLIFTPLVYLALGSSSGVVFGWFVNLTTIAGLIGWLIICVTYLRFFYGMRAQGTDRDGLPYKSPLQPYAAWTTLVALVVVILTSGYSGFFSGRWDVSSCLTYYIDIAIFISLWMVSLFFFRAKPVSLSDTDLSEIYLIEQERSEAKQMAILEEGFRDSWWRRWLI
ncbi:putative glycoside hydrolase, family 3, amino acid permease/ SLC12A domain-containing protein [Septoria linicola]|nr:putative glycoside hydrolase, family 3, amino acid permease/ SLC12A domain-containing protein [Septoria linicola]